MGQLLFEKTSIHLGELYGNSDYFTDIKISNKGAKKEYVLRVVKTDAVETVLSHNAIERDSSIYLRILIKPTKTGRVQYEIPVYTSDRSEPISIKVQAQVAELPRSNNPALTACPNFNERSPNSNLNFKLQVQVIDRETKESISASTLQILNNGKKLGQFKSDKNGLVVQKADLGYAYVHAEKEGYQTKEFGDYINFSRNKIVIELERVDNSKDLPPNEIEIILAEIVKEEVAEALEPSERIVAVEAPRDPFPEEEKNTPNDQAQPANYATLEQIPMDHFDLNYFSEINVVFVLDVSSSMRNHEKLDLLKYSLYELTDLVRKEDKIGIVSYATKAQVILPSTSGANKDSIRKVVEKLEASGSTAGGAGIIKGYEQVLENYSKSGVNHLIIITDGGFNTQSGDYKKMIKKYLKNNITLSVIGIKNKSSEEASMREIARLGNGQYVPIFVLEDAQRNLIHEIRRISYRK